ncbi:MAG: 1-acyl-sn-glycerol-3-phosphate acyltransferase [Candidatus Bipolaricaulota bacterium]|nr:MAG: 1-acyl-sn-glycerol-3-phosphate acyltransferase [Candidatus Bipolaricaulota bacterium]
MTISGRLLDLTTCAVVRLLCRVDAEQIDRVPMRGPLILITNHVNMLEIPVLQSRLRPRPITGVAKAEAWNNRVVGWLLDQWGAIPVRRGESDMGALRRSLDALRQGHILAIAPEGTRSRHGRLQQGRPGVVTIALRSGAPILPLAFHGGEKLRENLKRLRRTPFHIAVGEPFRIDPGSQRVDREIRRRITNEIMYRLAALLPPAYRGVYADLENATESFLRPAPSSA